MALTQDDFLPSHASVVVLVGRGWERRWARGGSEGDDSGEDAECVMRRMCLSTQTILSASFASIVASSSVSPSVCSALRAAVLVVAHLQPHLRSSICSTAACQSPSVIHRPRRSIGPSHF